MLLFFFFLLSILLQSPSSSARNLQISTIAKPEPNLQNSTIDEPKVNQQISAIDKQKVNLQNSSIDEPKVNQQISAIDKQKVNLQNSTVDEPKIWLNTSATSAINPWRNFSNFIDLERGSSIAGISQLREYFLRFGYQKSLALPVTGKLDSETLAQIMAPRCGMADNHHPQIHTTKRFAYFSGKPRWSKPSLTYAFSNSHTIDYLPSSEIKSAFRKAFSRWSAVIPVKFIETEDYTSADVKIGFYRGDHGDGEDFDGVLGILAHAFSPESGKLHLDGAERWAVDFGEERKKEAIDLESVATHEIGHVLGLGHSRVKEAIMYPSLSPRTRKVELRVDDVEGVQALYGSNPDFELSTLLASEETSEGVDMGGRRRWWWGVLAGVFWFVVVL